MRRHCCVHPCTHQITQRIGLLFGLGLPSAFAPLLRVRRLPEELRIA
jgi:hypothetical protein